MADSNRERVVRERLEFVDIISSLRPQFNDTSLIRDLPGGGWTHPWLCFDSLRIYLLLTCFDVLGQPATFLRFQDWLSAKATRAERDAIVEKERLRDGVDFAEKVRSVHSAYLKLYATKRSFHRFVKEILPEESRRALFHSIMIRRIDPAINRELEQIDSEAGKLEFLFDLRNEYTHEAVSSGDVGAAIFPEMADGIIRHGVRGWGYVRIRSRQQGQYRLDYSVRKWPTVLRECVLAGLSHISCPSPL